MRRIYFIPCSEIVSGGITYRSPKYLGNGELEMPLTGLENIPGNYMDYGHEPLFLCVLEVTDVQHNILTAQADVLAAPANLKNQFTTVAITTLSNYLEPYHIPCDWITTGMRYKEVIRYFVWLFQFMQRYQGLYLEKLFLSGINLSTQFQDLSPNVQTRIKNVIRSLSYSPDAIQGTHTLRQIIKTLILKMSERPVNINGVSF